MLPAMDAQRMDERRAISAEVVGLLDARGYLGEADDLRALLRQWAAGSVSGCVAACGSSSAAPDGLAFGASETTEPTPC